MLPQTRNPPGSLGVWAAAKPSVFAKGRGESSLECSPTEGTTRKCIWVNALPLHVSPAQTQTLHAYHYCHLREEREQQADGAQKERFLKRTLCIRAHAEMSGKASHSVWLWNASSPWELNCIRSVTQGKRTVPQRVADISICNRACHFILGKDEETHMLFLCPQQVAILPLNVKDKLLFTSAARRYFFWSPQSGDKKTKGLNMSH